MRACLLLLGFLVAAAARSATPDSLEPPVVPLTIPGYALRVLDVQKRVVLAMAGRDIEASVPIFIYYPIPARTEAVRLIRQARDGLGRLSEKREWSAAELQTIVSQLEAGLGELEKEAKP
jgi:hypothetical protein